MNVLKPAPWDGSPVESLPAECFRVPLRLNFACGASRWPGFANSDTNREPGTEYVDLNAYPYPYEDESADLILISHALFMGNHGKPNLDDLGAVMSEFYRILQPEGWLRIDDNPLRCPDPEEAHDPAELQLERNRGYREEWKLPREALKSLLTSCGFRRVEPVGPGVTLTEASGESLEAVLGNHLGHYSFSLEAQK